MVLRLDSRFAVVWRDPFSLQFGVDPARVVLREVTPADERMIAALANGVSRSGLAVIAATSGGTEADATALLKALRPLLVDPAPPSPACRVSIVGSGDTVERIAGSLALAGVQVAVAPTVTGEECDLGITIGHYVLDPQTYGFWLRRDLPHLPVVFGDDSVTMGPLVDPGRTPCLYCLEHFRRDADASWAAIASQLWGRTSLSETPLVSTEVAARVSRLVLARLAGTGTGSGRGTAGRSMSARSFRLSVVSGEVTRRDWMPHPDCGCVAVPAGFSAGRPETGSPSGSGQPTRVATVVERA
jgi:bacteriocin biosynthesis cyclodehydratase domain-containing protein